MADWYRFDTLVKAQACLDIINNNPAFPITGRNALTGELAPDKQKTERWATVTECTDGKFGFSAPDDDMFDKLSIDAAAQTQLKIGVSVERVNQTWMPDSGEIN